MRTSRRTRRSSESRRRWLALIVALLGVSLALPSSAQDWKGLRASGALGERYDGLLVARDPSADPVAKRINSDRLELYAKRAAQLEVSIEEVGKIYFQENYPNLPNGTWIQAPDGSWTQKT